MPIYRASRMGRFSLCELSSARFPPFIVCEPVWRREELRSFLPSPVYQSHSPSGDSARDEAASRSASD